MCNKSILVTCQPDDPYYVWQNHLYIESCINNGFDEERIHILLYSPRGRPLNPYWDKLKDYYPKLNIYRYTDEGKGVSQLLSIYIPILRPHILRQHFDKFPELEKEVIIYTDSDILWTKPPDIEKFYEDDINYMSDAKSYMNSSYFDSKYPQMMESKKEGSKNRDFLEEICNLSGITKQKVVENNDNIGGVQYILKNINADFWRKVEKDIISIRTHLMDVNKQFYESENKGIQSWCADLWAVIFNLWYLNREVKIVPELDFTWGSDNIEKLKDNSIYHNAGIVSEKQGEAPVFYKGKYHRGLNPFNDPHLNVVINDDRSKKIANYYYVQKLIELKEKYNLVSQNKLIENGK